jgi:hypothetical protein
MYASKGIAHDAFALFPNITLILKLILSSKFRSETYKHPALISAPVTQLTPQC